MSEEERDSAENLRKETLISLARESVAKAYEQNPNALGVVIHGSRANEEREGEKQPRENSDLDVIPIRKNYDDKASEEFGQILWEEIGAEYNILVDTGPWGSLEWEIVLKAVNSGVERKKFQEEWKRLGNAPVVIGATLEIEAAVKKALLER